MNKLRVIKSFHSLPFDLQSMLMRQNPYGFDKKMINMKNAEGKLIQVFPFESEEAQYLIKINNLNNASVINLYNNRNFTNSEELEDEDSHEL